MATGFPYYYKASGGGTPQWLSQIMGNYAQAASGAAPASNGLADSTLQGIYQDLGNLSHLASANVAGSAASTGSLTAPALTSGTTGGTDTSGTTGLSGLTGGTDTGGTGATSGPGAVQFGLTPRGANAGQSTTGAATANPVGATYTAPGGGPTIPVSLTTPPATNPAVTTAPTLTQAQLDTMAGQFGGSSNIFGRAIADPTTSQSVRNAMAQLGITDAAGASRYGSVAALLAAASGANAAPAVAAPVNSGSAGQNYAATTPEGSSYSPNLLRSQTANPFAGIPWTVEGTPSRWNPAEGAAFEAANPGTPTVFNPATGMNDAYYSPGGAYQSSGAAQYSQSPESAAGNAFLGGPGIGAGMAGAYQTPWGAAINGHLINRYLPGGRRGGY